MNDFTLAELIILKNGIEYLPSAVNVSKNYMDKCGLIIDKLDDLITNYCDHDFEQTYDERNRWECSKCGFS